MLFTSPAVILVVSLFFGSFVLGSPISADELHKGKVYARASSNMGIEDGSTKNHPVVHQPNTDENVPVASTSHSLSMSNIKNPGFAKVKGGTVYYLYEAPADAADLKNELKVLETFLGKWNTNVGDDQSPPRLPSQTKAPPLATRLLVTKLNHKSTNSQYSNQLKHVSVYICTDDGWALNPHEYGANVHVFPVDGDVAKGYHKYSICSRRRRKLNNEEIKAALAAAEAKNFGTLGQGNLA